MISKIQSKFDELETGLNEVIAHLSNCPEELRIRKKGDEWNANQILYHLYISEKGTTAYLNKKILATDVKKSGLKELIASRLLQKALRNTQKKYRAPKMVSNMPDELNFDELTKDYRKVRKDLSSILDKFDEKMASKAYFKHPRAGRLNIHQTMGFLKSHFDRHQEQILIRSQEDYGKE